MTLSRLARLGAALILAIAVGAGPLTARADTELVSESFGCGYSRFYMPHTGTRGSLPLSLPVRGPAGALFGRTLGAAKNNLVRWTVPMSDGARVQVNRALLPVLHQVEKNLAAEAAQGHYYKVHAAYTSAYNSRTSVSHDGISYHALGAAIDINSNRNPYRLDNRLITDMPDWFVKAWEDAGMCWGGHWQGVKDTMHFSWVGPAGTPGYGGVPAPLPPLTDPAAFTSRAGSDHEVVFGPGGGQIVIDVSGDGAPDVVQMRQWGQDAVLEAATSRGGFEACGVWRWWIADPPPGRAYMADLTGSSRPDLVFVEDTGSFLALHSYSAADGYATRSDVITQVPSADSADLVFGDANGDGADDLWVVSSGAGGIDVQVWSAASSFAETIANGSVAGAQLEPDTRLAVADRDVDGREDLLMVTPGATASSVQVVSATALSQVAESVSAPALATGDLLGFEDYDGDGRPDLEVLSPDGVIRAWAGNTPLAGYAAETWFLPADFRCSPDTVPYLHEGRFADDDASVFVADIEWLADTSITRGCNPPFNDWFCPDDTVTRGQMAAFLNRALGLAPAQSQFVDTGGSVFEADIGALAAAGITKGCDPPSNQHFCPDDPVTRGQMAAFLVRALGLAAGKGTFVDTAGSVFGDDIASLAGAGITKGCDPPANQHFCPDAPVTRGQMAAFLHRAAAWLPG